MKMPYAICVATPGGQHRRILQALSRQLALWVMLALAGAGAANAQKTIPPPTNQLVNDFAGLLSPGQRAQLSNKLNAYARETSIQIAVVTEASLEGDEIFDYTVRLAQEWGIGGNDEKDNGILLYVARDERKMRIQTGYGAEGFLPDARAKRIIADIMTPAFREGNYYAGIDQATTAIMDFGRGEYTAEAPSESGKQAKGFPVWLILGFIVALVLLVIFFSNRKGKGGHGHRRDDDSGYDRNGRYDMDRYARRPRQPARHHRHPQQNTGGGGGGWFIFPFPGGGGGGGSWGGGGDSSGSDFGGFGGGDFGGGGAGGDW